MVESDDIRTGDPRHSSNRAKSMPKRPPHPDDGLQRGSSGVGADMAVEGHPKRADYSPDAPASRLVPPLPDGAKPDQLKDKVAATGDRQEALLDEAVEETFPGSDPISPSRVD
jgi:hypothetical protein